jgi:hypothetical protein
MIVKVAWSNYRQGSTLAKQGDTLPPPSRTLRWPVVNIWSRRCRRRLLAHHMQSVFL